MSNLVLMKKRLFLVLSIISASVTLNAQKDITLLSPDKKLKCTVRASNHGVKYKVDFQQQELISFSALSLTLKDGTSLDNMAPGKSVYKDSVEKYDLLTGRASHVESHYNEVTVPMADRGSGKSLQIIFRAFNEGIAFRYRLVQPNGSDSFAITNESNEFRLPGNPKIKALLLPSFTSSHEGHYTTTDLSSLQQDTLLDMPALFSFSSGAYLAITEAALLDYAGTYLIKKGGVLRSRLSPLPSDPLVMVRGRYPHVSPWRVLLISKDAGDFLESNILTTLSPPQRITDPGWLKPGKTTFPWWNGNVVPDTINAPGNNFVTNKYYIDFCSRNNIRYHSVVEYGLHQWYVDDGVGFQPGPHSDPSTPVPGLDMKEVCDYAHSRNVGIRVWVHWAALYPVIDKAFANFEKWGISGMMIDFMDRDDQEMVNIQTEMLEKAARHHLHVQFHGAYKPTGLSRTYPNEFTREGTLNYEVNKWGPALTASHDLDIAFTRLIAGSTDYHLGGFRAVPDSAYRVQYTRPLMLSTRCHMLALYVVFENANAMVCDYPEAYEGEPGFEFIKDVPTTFDETLALEARVDEYLVIARRKGKDWYIGVINSRKDRKITVPLSFLPSGNYDAEIFSDKDPRDPNSVMKELKKVDNSGTISLSLSANGGAAIHLRAK